VPAAFTSGCGAADQDDPAARERLRSLVAAHVGEENDHDLAGILDTFSDQSEMVINGRAFRDRESIRQGHIDFGMSSAAGGLSGTRVEPGRQYFSDGVLLVEGRVLGKHVGDAAGFRATNRDVELPYMAFYRFDARGKLVSERIVMNWGPLAL
jgi:hypothetical protein